MRKSILLVLLAACTAESDGSHYIIRDFAGRSVRVACDPVQLGREAPDEVRGASDTSFVVLNAAERRITEYGDDLVPLWTLRYEMSGPAAIDRPVSVALLGDTAVAVVARGGLELVVVSRDGRLISSTPLGFIPSSVATTASGGVLVTPMPVGTRPRTLLVRFRGRGPEELPVPKRPYADMTVGALGNAALVEAFPDGRALLVHQFFAPRAFGVALGDDGATVTPRAVPTPDATADLIDAVPRPPITDDQFDQVLVPALAMGVDRGADEVYLLTRSGGRIDDQLERAVMRLDRELGYLGSYILDVPASKMAVLPRRDAVLVADALDRFFLCPVDADTRAE